MKAELNAGIENPKSKIQNPLRVLVCAGGTGGGIYPALTAAAELQKSGGELLWVGTKGEMEETLVPRAGFPLETIRGGAIVSVPPHVMLKNGLLLGFSFFKAIGILRRFRPDVMFMTGGYMSAPVTLAARLLGVPICIFLPDVEPGSSIKFALPHAQKVAAASADSAAFLPAEKLVVTGYPVRAELRQAVQMSRAEALSRFNLTETRPCLFVFGGRRGSWNINQALMTCLPDVLADFQVIHVSGNLTWDKVAAFAQTLPAGLRAFYRPYPYLHEEMGAAYRAADLVVARAGASMIGESPAFAVPAILVPLAWAWRYQKVNADFLTNQGAAVQLTDEELPENLLPTVRRLLGDAENLVQMRTAAQALDKPGAVNRLADVIREVGRGEPAATAVGADS
ncbi:MAG: glycosyltransferase [Anaerolineae bacterium]